MTFFALGTVLFTIGIWFRNHVNSAMYINRLVHTVSGPNPDDEARRDVVGHTTVYRPEVVENDNAKEKDGGRDDEEDDDSEEGHDYCDDYEEDHCKDEYGIDADGECEGDIEEEEAVVDGE